MRTGPALIANLITNGLVPQLHRAGLDIAQSPVSPQQMAILAHAVEQGIVNFSDAKRMIRRACETRK